MLVFLIHGMGRTSFSMRRLGGRLNRMGHQTSLFGYRVFRHPLEQIAAEFASHIESVRSTIPSNGAGEHPAPYVIIGHSLGNIIARMALPTLEEPPHQLVMLGPPNNSPLLARRLKNRNLFRLLTGNAGLHMATPEFYENLPIPQMPTLVIAGSAGPKGRLSPFGQDDSDGIVAVAETRLKGAQHAVIPGVHTFLMDHPQTYSLICQFLDSPQGAPLPETVADSEE
jgi:pimeloyl-ACP methyl ester carboxylesterase